MKDNGSAADPTPPAPSTRFPLAAFSLIPQPDPSAAPYVYQVPLHA